MHAVARVYLREVARWVGVTRHQTTARCVDGCCCRLECNQIQSLSDDRSHALSLSGDDSSTRFGPQASIADRMSQYKAAVDEKIEQKRREKEAMEVRMSVCLCACVSVCLCAWRLSHVGIVFHI